jgi:hypothetical protein
MSRAKNQFDESIKDAEELLAHFDAAKPPGGKPPPPTAEVLKRAGLILAITAWETYVEDRAREALDANLTALAGSPVAQFMKSKFDEEMKRFHNPNTDKTAKLFTDYTGKDVTQAWNCNPGGPAPAKKTLDEWVKRRGQAAHRSPPNGSGQPAPAHLLSREDLDKLIKFLKTLVTQTETNFS